MAPMLDDVKAKIEEKRERVKARIEEFKANRGSSSSPPKILAEVKEKGLIPAIRERREAARARRKASFNPEAREGEIEPKLKRIRETQWR